jgi:pectate lyase
MPVSAQVPIPAMPPAEAPATPECPVCPVCPPTTPPVTPPGTCAQKPIASANFTRETGFAYIVRMNFGTPPDKVGALTRSKLRLFENGVELGPAHSQHGQVRTLGKGRFSHWLTGRTHEAVRMSASDNSNPSTNGKTYTYCIGATAP